MQTNNLDTIRSFVKAYADMKIMSTGSQSVSVTDDVFNVSGSSGDPIPNGASSWVALLKLEGVNVSRCYVTATTGCTKNDCLGHGKHVVIGGHMTLKKNGSVQNRKCYLMPLCKRHNSTSFNTVAFAHKQTKMLELSGYMLKDTAATFKARLSGNDEVSDRLLYHDGGDWRVDFMDTESLNTKAFKSLKSKSPDAPFVHFKRLPDGNFEIDSSSYHFPGK